ncbi:CHAT domain-containing protein [Lactarius quietus]|nr:CHAT domain-containing protein [Lactarius quietus]
MASEVSDSESIADIDRKITTLQSSLSLYPRSHSEHINCIYNLAEARWARYQLSDEKEDLENHIVHCTEAIFLPPISRDGPHLNNVFQLFFRLANALLERSESFQEHFQEPDGVKYSIQYLRYLQGLSLDSFGISRNNLATSLIRALRIQVESGEGDGVRNIKEMVDLCRELLTSNLSGDFLVASVESLHQAFVFALNQEDWKPLQLLDEIIECLRDAVKMCPPDSYHVLYALADSLYTRFTKTAFHSNDDYQEAEVLLEKILNPDQPGECPDLVIIQDLALGLATLFASSRWSIFRSPEYLEEAISRSRAELRSPSIDEGRRLKLTYVLENMTRIRCEEYGLPEKFEEANSAVSQLADEVPENSENFSQSMAVLKPCSMTWIAEKIQHLEERLSITPGAHRDQNSDLISLANLYRSKFYRTGDASDIDQSIKYIRALLDATQSGDPTTDFSLLVLSDFLLLAFERTGKISYLDESIAVGYEILRLEVVPISIYDSDIHCRIINQLVSSLLTRENLLGRIEDPREAIRLIAMAIENQYGQESHRFQLSCVWAIIARRIGHPTTLTAYGTAMSLLQKVLSFVPTVSIQHARLVAMGVSCQTMPLEYASHQIDLGQIENAIETLEQGRALLWSEMRSLRAPMAQFVEEDSPFAKRFVEINQELEALTMSVTPSGRLEIEDGVVAQGKDWMDPFGQHIVKRQKLVEERDALISQIQGQPRLEGLAEFLLAPSFTTLRSAASRGPIILINHSEWRSDIVILFHDSPPCSIPTADNFYACANKLRDELVEARKRGLDSKEYQDALCSVLKGLYELVGRPVIKRLQESGVPEQSRIWLCPTSVFCSLPLHAMGPIPSSETRKQYFSDLYIPSYTPSLSALLDSRKASPQVPESPSLLLVAQPDDSLPGVTGEIKVILERALKARVTVTGLVSSEATPSSVLEGFRGSRLAHLACHGVLTTGKPFEASFKLHGGSRLTLLEIIRSQLPDAEFAFLSCCHAAEITAESIFDEALHLTAAMQYCGFRSVVGTMWEMADTDGRDLAKNFYKSLLSREDSGVPYYERSAGALRDATQKLRGKRGINLERWVNFVHYGA